MAQNLIPNPSFEEGQGGVPTGWKVEGGTGAWENTGHTGRHCVSVTGDGKEGSVLWRCDGVKMQPGQTYRFSYWTKSEGATGGCVVSGPSFANRDFGSGDKWTQNDFVFVAPPDVMGAYLRIGVWAMNGKVLFDDVSLQAVTPVSSTVGDLSLCQGEEVKGTSYTFEPDFSYEGSNYSPNLVSYTCGFNSNRWPFGPGARLTFRQGLPGLEQTSGKVMVSLGYFAQGSCVIEASRDGQAWERVGVFTKQGGGTLDLPATLFPAEQVFVRIASPGEAEARAEAAPGSFQVTGYKYKATLDKDAGQARGATSFLDVLRATPDVDARVLSLGDLRPGGSNAVALKLRNTTAKDLALRCSVDAVPTGAKATATPGKPANIPAGQEVTVALPYEVAGAGDYTLGIQVAGPQTPVFAATSKFTVASLYAADYGYLLSKDEDNFGPDVWWCESTYKVSRDRPRPKTAGKGISIAAARNESEAFQIVFRSSRGEGSTNAYVQGPEGWPDSCWTIDRVAYHYVKTPSDYSGCVGWWPDALPKWGVYDIPKHDNTPMWITVHVPETAKAGKYRAKFHIEGDSWGMELPIDIRVYDFTLSKEPHIESGFGLDEGAIARYQNLTNIEDRRKVWDLYMQDFRDHRMCVYNFAPFDPMNVTLTGGMTSWSGGEVSEEAPASGKHCLKIVDDSPTAAIEANYTKKLPVAQNTRYRLAWKCRTAIPQQHYQVTMGQHTADGTWLSGNNIDIERVGDGTWKSEEFMIEPGRLNPQTAQLSLTLRPVPWSEKGEAMGTAWFDDVFFGTAGSDTNMIEDGGFEAGPEDIKPVADFAAWDKQAEKYLDGYGFTNFVVPIMGLGGMTYNAEGTGRLGPYKQGSDQYNKLFKQMAMMVQDHLEQKGWLHKAYVYFVDEPPPSQYPYCKQYNELIKMAAPKIRRMLTIQPVKELYGDVDIWCVIEPALNPTDTRARQKQGDTIWWYVCTGPKAPWPGLFIDHSAIDLRMWLWMTVKYDVQGVLIWTTNWWTSSAAFPKEPQNPWTDPMGYVDSYGFQPGQVATWGNGDGRMFYPPNQDVNNDKTPHIEGPVNSIRWEMLAKGIDDYEYFWTLRQSIAKAKQSGKNAKLIAEAEALLIVPDAIASDLMHFTKDPQILIARRARIAEMIEKLNGKQ
jgi:hypothetical protein